MRVLFATSNPHKIEEVQAILKPLGIEVLGLDSLDEVPPEPTEDADTFEANARKKAMVYAHATGRPCLADDSGLEVDALNGAPGVHSARYALGQTISPSDFETMPRDERDLANNALLLERMQDVPESLRRARFVCAMCLADPEGSILAETRGTFEGTITLEPRGDNGFGYDPLLELAEFGLTSAELPPDQKNTRSHRGEAARQMAEAMRELGFGSPV